ncbi:hypothetical protein LXL04_015240 [Taraxacum kok-saghyz]
MADEQRREAGTDADDVSSGLKNRGRRGIFLMSRGVVKGGVIDMIHDIVCFTRIGERIFPKIIVVAVKVKNDGNVCLDVSNGDSDQMWTSSERFYPNVNKFGTFLPKCGQDGSGYSKPLPLLFPVVDGNIAGDAPPPLILRLFLSLRLREFEREIGGGSRAFLFSWAVHQNIYRYRVNDIQSRLNHPKTLSVDKFGTFLPKCGQVRNVFTQMWTRRLWIFETATSSFSGSGWEHRRRRAATFDTAAVSELAAA